MIKFFRHIRQKLLTENKFSKYLIYAIGEIILVVIGILLALNINNRNEVSKLKQKELILLTEMQQNLKEDLNILNDILRADEEKIRSNEIVKVSLETKLAYNDSLKHHFGNVFGSWDFIANIAAWENLKSIGLDLISNDSLRSSLSHLYSMQYAATERYERTVDERFQWEQLYPQIIKHINIDTMFVSGTPNNYEGLVQDKKFLEVIKMNIFTRKFIHWKYNNVRKNVTRVLEQIDRHIQYLKK